MRFLSYSMNGTEGLAVEVNKSFRGIASNEADYPGDLLSLIRSGGSVLESAAKVLAASKEIDLTKAIVLPPIANPEKVVCIGLNYIDHASESKMAVPTYPTVFGRFNSSLTGHDSPIVSPHNSDQLDFEGELVAIIGKRARNVSEAEALDHVVGYSIFNDASVRDFQIKAPQWTPGKNFDDTGAFGPSLVTADVLPRGCKGLRLTTRLNGETVQTAMIDEMIFSVASLIAILSEFMTLEPGDVIVTGTPAGVGAARKPPLFMKDGDVCEV